MLRAIDICCGAGGWAVAARGLPIRILHAYDCWEEACQTYELNHPNTRVHRADLREGLPNLEELHGGVDLILGGIPCSWLSTARGRNRATADEVRANRRLLRSSLKIVRDLKPPWWCLEDVIQLRNELPLSTPCRVIESRVSGYSIQARKRLFAGVFPAPKPGKLDGTFRQLADRGPYRVHPTSLRAKLVPFGKRRGASPSKLKTALPVLTDRFLTVLGSWSGRHGNTAPVILDGAIRGGRREITWGECARLQGFPDDYVFVGSLTAVTQMVGNAIQIDTGRAILRAICEEAGNQA